MDIISHTLHVHKADMTDLKKQVKEATGDQKELAKAELEAAEARNEHFEGWIKGLAKVSVGLLAVKETFEVVWEGYKEGIKEARFETAAYGVDIEKLSEAAGGLKTNMQLLEFAAKAHTGAFKLNTEQLEIAEKAMRTLTERGYDAAQVQEAFTNALVSGRVRGLEPFGIIVDKTGLAMDANGVKMDTLGQKTELVGRLFSKLGEYAEHAGEGEAAVGEEGERAAIKLHNSWEKLKVGLGQLVIAMAPLLDALARAVGLVADLSKAKRGDHGGVGFHFKDFILGATGTAGAYGLAEEGIENVENDEMVGAAIKGLKDSGAAATLTAIAQKHIKLLQLLEEKYPNIELDKTPDYVRKEGKPYTGGGGFETIIGGKAGERDESFGRRKLQGLGAEDDHDLGRLGGLAIQEQIEGIEATRQKAVADAHKQRESLLESIFGKPSDIQLYTQLFQTLTNTLGGMYTQIVEGADMSGNAIRKSIGKAVEAIGLQMFVEGLKETGLAIGDTAKAIGGDPDAAASAAVHYTAAAKDFAGAIAAGAIASTLGVGGSAPSGGGGGGGSGSGGSAGGGGAFQLKGGNAQPQKQVVIIMADAQDGSVRQQTAKSKRIIEQALGTPGIRDE